MDYFSEGLSSGGVCLAHAPTGIGKTLAALLGAIPHLPEGGKIIYAVNRKNQIPIIIKELRMINECNGTDYKVTAFASKADLCRDPETKKLSYRELVEVCELRRMNWACPYYRALFEGGRESGTEPDSEPRRARRKSKVAGELEARMLEEMPPPHMIEKLARTVEQEIGGPPVCIYELLKWTAKQSHVLAGTFWYSFHPLVAASLLRTLSLRMKDCILICDEAHNLPKFCRDALSDGISATRVQYAIQEASRNSSHLEESGISEEGIVTFLSAFLGILRRFKFTSEGAHLPLGLARMVLKKAGIDPLEGPVTSLEAAGSVVLETRIREGLPPLSHLAIAASFIRPFLLCEDRSFERFCVLSQTPKGKSARRLEMRCLDPAVLSSEVLDPAKPTGVRGAILMSGTLVPGGYYRDILGIPFASHREFPNIFPQENRVLFLDDSISLAWKARSQDMYSRILQRIIAIRENTPGGCMFFFPSYDVMRELVALYPLDDILVEKRAATKKEEVEGALISGRNILAVMGASLSEGLDLPGLVKAIAIFGLPLERVSDTTRLGINYYNAKFPGRGRDYFYHLPAVTKIVQSAGRAHRRSENKAALYVFDRRFCRYYLGSAPSWWKDEAVRLNGVEDLVRSTRDFWAGQGSARGDDGI